MSQSTSTPTFTTGDRFRKAREHAGISSQHMADVIGVSRNTVGNYEHDRTEPTLSAIRAYVEETGVDVVWLLDLDGADLRSRCFRDDGADQLELLWAA